MFILPEKVWFLLDVYATADRSNAAVQHQASGSMVPQVLTGPHYGKSGKCWLNRGFAGCPQSFATNAAYFNADYFREGRKAGR